MYCFMKWLNNNWIFILLLICFACLLANGIVVYYYCSMFGNSFSQETKDWNLFMIIFNGIITAVLAVVNISAVIKINTSIDNNSEKRYINNMLFEAQTILAKMRLDDYNLIKGLINEIKVAIFRKKLSSNTIVLLKKKLMEMDNSFLYKNQNLHDQPFLRPLTMNLVVQIDDFVKKVKKSNEVEAKDEEELLKYLSSFQNTMEFYIVSQLVRSSFIQKYISNNQDETDCTISCIYDFAKELNEKLEAESHK